MDAKPIECRKCERSFATRDSYDKHKKDSCSKKRSKKQNFSARKSFSKPQKMNGFREFSGVPFSDDGRSKSAVHSTMDSLLDSDSGFLCEWCRSSYPTKVLLRKHLEKNPKCAKAHLKSDFYSSTPKVTHSARKSFGAPKSLVARKSFSRPKFNNHSVEGSARKSFSKSPKSKSKKLFANELTKVANECPVCLSSFGDPFEFFQHQKKLNHWGKATKSMSSTCKCPFCHKQFFHVRARNAHVRNHADKSKEDIDSFLRNSTCQLCSQIFVSEVAKYQHMRVEHPQSTRGSAKSRSKTVHSSFPPAIRRGLERRPRSCPVCSKEFPTTFYRDKHFVNVHLESEIECPFCFTRFHSIEKLETHMQSRHYDDFEFKCFVCNFNLPTTRLAALHVEEVHPDEEMKDVMQSRQRTKPLKKKKRVEVSSDDEADSPAKRRSMPYYCDVCDTHFQKLCGLQSHRMSRSHRDALKTQMQSSGDSNSALDAPPQKAKPRPQPKILTCNECLDEFSAVKDFVPHRLSHFGVQSKYLKISEENLYTCEICGEVSNSHSKVQMHLFWHLQVESTANTPEDSTPKQPRLKTAAPESNVNLVAKKSFSKSSDSQQEVVIGGVVKSLFTCEFCNIGFTTQAHYSLHVRKFCRMKNEGKKDGKGSESNLSLPGIDILTKSLSKSNTLDHCTDCSCLLSPAVDEIHDNICGETTDTTPEDVDTDHLKSKVQEEDGVAACIRCEIVFASSDSYSEHMLGFHKVTPQSASETKGTAESNSSVLCTSCNCLFFAPSVLEDHKSFCSNTSYCDFDSESVEDILRAAEKLHNPVAACISCSIMFETAQCMSEHMLTHKKKSSPGRDDAPDDSMSLSNEERLTGVSDSSMNDTNISLENDLEAENGERKSSVGSDSSIKNTGGLESSLETDSIGKNTSTSNADATESDKPSVPEAELADDEDPIVKLRFNFTHLFCILINDSALMEQLGYGTQPVDEVLGNVLEQMGQDPAKVGEGVSEIECLRRNIRALLDVCLADQIKELDGEGRTAIDDIVVKALKMFESTEGDS